LRHIPISILVIGLVVSILISSQTSIISSMAASLPVSASPVVTTSTPKTNIIVPQKTNGVVSQTKIQAAQEPKNTQRSNVSEVIHTDTNDQKRQPDGTPNAAALQPPKTLETAIQQTTPLVTKTATVLLHQSTGLTTLAIADSKTGIATVRGLILTYNKSLGWDVAHLLAESLVTISQAHALDYRLLAGVIAVESSFRSDAVSSSGAIGLGQLKPTTAQWLGISNPFDPLENMVGVSRYLRFLINRYNGDLDSALSAYFQGQGSVDRNGITQACVPYLTKINEVIHRF
jgi:hypothetical protein